MTRSEDNQKTALFTGEGAYHGSSKTKKEATPKALPFYLSEYVRKGIGTFDTFEATFPNYYDLKSSLPIPSQEEIKNDAVTFCWTPIEQAIQEAGPVSKLVLQEMESLLERNKRFVYIDSKIQYFHETDLPVDSKLWHIDGSLAIRDPRLQSIGYSLLHDMKTRLLNTATPNRYLAYQSSYHCATQFATAPLSITIPDCIPSFDLLDEVVQAANPTYQSQPAGSIVAFDELSLHRAVPATASGWRLWIRCIETDKEVKIDSSIAGCYGTVFRTLV